MDLTIPIPDILVRAAEAIAAFVAFLWTLYQHVQHKRHNAVEEFLSKKLLNQKLSVFDKDIKQLEKENKKNQANA